MVTRNDFEKLFRPARRTKRTGSEKMQAANWIKCSATTYKYLFTILDLNVCWTSDVYYESEHTCTFLRFCGILLNFFSNLCTFFQFGGLHEWNYYLVTTIRSSQALKGKFNEELKKVVKQWCTQLNSTRALWDSLKKVIWKEVLLISRKLVLWGFGKSCDTKW